MNQPEKNEEAAKAIAALGGTAEVARLFSVSMPSVSDWKKDGIPRARVMFLRAAKSRELKGVDLDAATSTAPELAKKRRPTAESA